LSASKKAERDVILVRSIQRRQKSRANKREKASRHGWSGKRGSAPRERAVREDEK